MSNALQKREGKSNGLKNLRIDLKGQLDPVAGINRMGIAVGAGRAKKGRFEEARFCKTPKPLRNRHTTAVSAFSSTKF